MKVEIAWLNGLALLAAIYPAAARELGDPKAGLSYADQVCSECHAVRGGQRVSPHGRAPSFELVANAQGMTATALRVWFDSPHPSMPDLLLSEKQSDDLIAYILSLKKR